MTHTPDPSDPAAELANLRAENERLLLAIEVLAQEVSCLRGVQRDLCDKCIENGLGKRGRCYAARINTDFGAISRSAVDAAVSNKPDMSRTT